MSSGPPPAVAAVRVAVRRLLASVRPAERGRGLGWDRVLVRGVTVGTAGGPEAAARTARYTALAEAAQAAEPDVRVAETAGTATRDGPATRRSGRAPAGSSEPAGPGW